LASAALGVNVAVFVAESYATVPVTAPSPVFASVKVAVVIVVASIGRENVALTSVLVATPVAPEAGTVDVTVGGAGAAVVKLQLTGAASGVPSEALTVDATFAV
jgi:hypothetical protein